MTTLPISQQAYRMVIAINNVACSLLNKRCYSQAHLTLIDATQAMLRLCGEDANAIAHHDHCSDTDLLLELSRRLHAANKRLAFPGEAMETSNLSTPLPPQCPVALRVEAEELEFNEGFFSDLVLMSSITMHNTALLYLCQALEDPLQSCEKREKLQCKAVNLFNFSYLLVRENNAEWTVQTAILAVHILESLTKAISLTGCVQETSYHKLFADLEVLRSAVNNLALDADSHGGFAVAPAA
jgi:hypothetical protein